MSDTISKQVTRTRGEISRAECQRDPIFLLQVRRTAGVADDFKDEVEWDYDAESYRYKRRKVTEEYLIKNDMLLTYWDVESVWMYREEAEAEAKRREYYYGKKGMNWRVYSVRAEESLVDLLNSSDIPSNQGEAAKCKAGLMAMFIRKEKETKAAHDSTIQQMTGVAARLREALEEVREEIDAWQELGAAVSCIRVIVDEALSSHTEDTGLQKVRVWNDGVPPDFIGRESALIVVEIPSPFSGVNVVGYTSIRWNGERWSHNEVYRARRWIEIPLPGITDGGDQDA